MTGYGRICIASTLASVVLLFGTYSARAQESISCAECHRNNAHLEEGSVHAQAGIRCIDCHGGNPTGKTVKEAHGEQFSGRPATKDIPRFCARCHSDVRMMNPYGTPTDQYAQYLTSKHGEELAKENKDVATCISCHHSHGIRRVRDPQSPVYPKNVPATCGKCHGDKSLMDRYNLPSNQEELYRRSVHAEMLLKKNDLSAPTCATCHGNHGAVPPGFSNILHLCGKCHVKQQDLFVMSPHASFVEDKTFKGCAQCHGNHLILRTATDIFPRCAECHDSADEAMRKRDAINASIRSVEESYGKTRAHWDHDSQAGYPVENEEAILGEAKTSLLQMPLVQHTLDVAKVKKLASETEDILATVRTNLGQKEKEEKTKTMALLPIWIFLIVMAVLFAVKKKEIEQRERRNS